MVLDRLWQKGEREATEDISAGRVETLTDDKSFLDFIGTHNVFSALGDSEDVAPSAGLAAGR